MLDASTLRELSDVALAVARSAAALVYEGFSRGLARDGAREKASADLVTDYDLRSEQLIRDELARLTPELPVVGEERGGAASDAGPTWFCDPIDGTTNFVHGLPMFCVSVGLMEAGRPLAGAVVAPALGTAYRGFVAPDGERDAWRDDKPCRVSRCTALGDAFVATGFHPRAPAGETEANLRCLARVLPRVRGVRRCGSAALDLCMVAGGIYDAYWEHTLNVWDTAGGAALVLAAGGRLSDLHGGPPALERGHILASNGRIHEPMLALLDEAEKGG